MRTMQLMPPLQDEAYMRKELPHPRIMLKSSFPMKHMVYIYAEVNVTSTNHLTDAAVVVTPNEA